MAGTLVAPGADGVAAKAPPVAHPSYSDVTKLVDWLRELLQITLGASPKDLDSPGSLFSDVSYAETVQMCRRFALENQLALYVEKHAALRDGINGVDHADGMTHL